VKTRQVVWLRAIALAAAMAAQVIPAAAAGPETTYSFDEVGNPVSRRACVRLGCTPAFCGTTADGCGGTLSCTCPGGQVCTTSNACCTPTVTCAGKCGALASDGCGRALSCGGCALGQVCTASNVCACAPGYTACSGSCVDLLADPKHCGACGRQCASGSVCSAGSCRIPCPSGSTDCGDGTCAKPPRQCP
jgi:hypothetical protein